MRIHLLGSEPDFPDPALADHPDGLVAVGGDLSPRRVVAAYARGIFPWPIKGAPLAWFSPDPRMVLDWTDLRVSRSMRKESRAPDLRVSMDEAFERVVAECARVPRPGQPGTWITHGIRDAYTELHEVGVAHSVEVWSAGELIGGLYGVSLGAMFCGESMFHRRTGASKLAFVTLARQLEAWGFDFLDCQLHTSHLESLGAHTEPRAQYLERLARAVQQPTRQGRWALEVDHRL
ncbi:MAG: leucyl/phenylalanyl-tRNA--protein transferase [Myxococcales bacterium]|nr:leucyl/phenylalanyl-tRNA--protein transferase [Myxococcales bacterium]MCB9531784.1 leucyl/phenylalanyl-tRNA--protein transferase [Myxococcales bacterium]